MLYEAGIYNKEVRDCIRGGDDWNNQLGISDKFEEVNYFEFQAASMEEAEKNCREQVSSQFRLCFRLYKDCD